MLSILRSAVSAWIRVGVSSGDPLVSGALQLPSIRSYYREVLDVALAIIERKGVLLEKAIGDLRLPSLAT